MQPLRLFAALAVLAQVRPSAGASTVLRQPPPTPPPPYAHRLFTSPLPPPPPPPGIDRACRTHSNRSWRLCVCHCWQRVIHEAGPLACICGRRVQWVQVPRHLQSAAQIMFGCVLTPAHMQRSLIVGSTAAATEPTLRSTGVAGRCAALCTATVRRQMLVCMQAVQGDVPRACMQKCAQVVCRRLSCRRCTKPATHTAAVQSCWSASPTSTSGTYVVGQHLSSWKSSLSADWMLVQSFARGRCQQQHR